VIKPRPLTVTAVDQERLYGSPNPEFTVTYSNFALGEDESALDGTLTFETTATQMSSVIEGGYAIMPSGLTATNYAIQFVAGTLTILPAPLVVSADSLSRIYGLPNPPLTATFSGLMPWDDGSVVTNLLLATEATQESDVGVYVITVTGDQPQNYQVSFVNGTLTVLPMPFPFFEVPSGGPGLFPGFGGPLDDLLLCLESTEDSSACLDGQGKSEEDGEGADAAGESALSTTAESSEQSEDHAARIESAESRRRSA